MANKLFVGTSGYSYKEWKGSFYPEDLKSNKFLEFYSEHLESVEINNTFYRFPSRSMLEGWCETTPEDFCFAIKAHTKITHKARLKDVESFVVDLVERCRLLGPRLGPLLFQLPPFLRCDVPRLEQFLEWLPAGERYTLEFRHSSWFVPEVYEALRSAGVALCISEDDKFDTPREVTADFTYLRLRREQYDDSELSQWRDWYAPLVEDGLDAYVYLKHDEEGASPQAALSLLKGPTSS